MIDELEPSPALRRYAKLSAVLDAMESCRVPEDDQDRVRDAMDEPWYALSQAERDGINDGSIDLWSLGLAVLIEDHPPPSSPQHMAPKE